MQTLDFKEFISKYVGIDGELYYEFDQIVSFLRICNLQAYGWLAGGAVRRIISGQKLDSDYDLFFTSLENLELFWAGIEKDKNIKITKEISSEHNVTLILDCKEYEIENLKLQLIKIEFYSSLEEVLRSFDYTLCQFGLDGNKLVCGETSLWDLGRKRIVINTITYPVASLRRLLKYTSQGYYACQGCLVGLLSSVRDDPKSLDGTVKYID